MPAQNMILTLPPMIEQHPVLVIQTEDHMHTDSPPRCIRSNGCLFSRPYYHTTHLSILSIGAYLQAANPHRNKAGRPPDGERPAAILSPESSLIHYSFAAQDAKTPACTDRGFLLYPHTEISMPDTCFQRAFLIASSKAAVASLSHPCQSTAPIRISGLILP